MGDYLRLSDYFPLNVFDLVVEKAGLDSIATKETPEVPDLLQAAYAQIYNILKPGGLYVSISHKNFGNLHKLMIDFYSVKLITHS